MITGKVFDSSCVRRKVASGSITTGFGLRKFQTSGIQIYGSAGTLQFIGQDWDPKGLQLWTAETGCWRLVEESATWPWTDGVRDFCASIIEGASGDLNRTDHVLHVLDIIDQALASLDCGMPMAVASRFAPPSLQFAVGYEQVASYSQSPDTHLNEEPSDIMAYKWSPHPTFSEPTLIPYDKVTRYLWGDDEAGLVNDWIYLSSGKIHQLIFGFPAWRRVSPLQILPDHLRCG